MKVNSPNTVTLVTVANGDIAVFVNSSEIASLEASDHTGSSGLSLDEVAKRLATALGTSVRHVSVATPEDPEWNWNDVAAVIANQPEPSTEIRKVVISLVVLHDDSIPWVDAMDLHRIATAIDCGDVVGRWDVIADNAVALADVKAELLAVGNDGTFFAHVLGANQDATDEVTQ